MSHCHNTYNAVNDLSIPKLRTCGTTTHSRSQSLSLSPLRPCYVDGMCACVHVSFACQAHSQKCHPFHSESRRTKRGYSIHHTCHTYAEDMRMGFLLDTTSSSIRHEHARVVLARTRHCCIRAWCCFCIDATIALYLYIYTYV